jgi:hypothetical protein
VDDAEEMAGTTVNQRKEECRNDTKTVHSATATSDYGTTTSQSIRSDNTDNYPFPS